MPLTDHIDRLREKPEHIRRRIAFWSAGGMSVLIFVFWMASFSISGHTASGALSRAAAQARSPVTSMVAAVGDLFSDLRNLIWSPKKVQYVNVEAIPKGQ